MRSPCSPEGAPSGATSALPWALWAQQQQDCRGRGTWSGTRPCSAVPFSLLCRPCDENHPDVKPDAYVNNLAEAVDIILQQL